MGIVIIFFLGFAVAVICCLAFFRIMEEDIKKK